MSDDVSDDVTTGPDATEVTPAPASRRAGLVAGALSRLRWLWLTATTPALRGQPRPGLAGRGTWVFRGDGRAGLGAGARLTAGHYLFVQGELTIGESFYANRDFYLCCMHEVRIGSRVRCGERVSIHDENHLFEPVGPRLRHHRDGYTVRPIVIGDDVWLGANVVVLQGVTVGANTVVAANSVVTGDLPAGVLAAGAPARVLRELAVETDETDKTVG